MQPTVEKPDKETLTMPERIGEVAVILALLFLLGFFWLHQTASTGFFTPGFGALAMLALYGPIVIALAPPAVRALTGRRNPARPLEAAANASLALGTFWLLITFPLDFSRLGDVLPASLRFLLGWVTDDLGRIPMIFQVVGMPISAVVNLLRYFAVRHQEAASPSRPKMA